MSASENKILHIRIMLGFSAFCFAALFFVPPIAQPLEYHQFADSRSFLGIPNFLNVISNILFLAAAVYGLKLLFDPREGTQGPCLESRIEVIPYTIFFAAAALVCFGSAYYHWSPDNTSLVWDRLPITVLFTSLLAIMISERINQRAGLILLPFLFALGIFSVYHWHQSELMGAGDLRLYLIIQCLSALLILYMLFFLPSHYSRSNRFGWILILYVVAKAAEFFDQEIFDLQQWVSGHTVKHMLAALAVLILVEMLRCRISINRVQRITNALDQY